MGLGLERPADLTIPIRMCNAFCKRADPSKAGMLLNVVSSGLWPASRSEA